MIGPETDPRVKVHRLHEHRAGNGHAEDTYDQAAAESLGAREAPKKFELIPFKEIKFSSGSRWLVKGLLASSGLAVIFGAPKHYKSFVAADAALHIASGRPWAGRRVQQGAVVYIVGEGQSGFSDRIAANRRERKYPDDLPFFLIKARPNLGMMDGDREALIASIGAVITPLGIRLSAVFVDTLVRTLAGASENDEGMRNFTDNAEAIADHFNCLAVAVHHTGKDTAKGMRGSSALHGAVVTSWRVEKTEPLKARVTLEDAKDGECGLSWTADLERIVYGKDEDGDDESVLLISAVSEPAREGSSSDASAAANPNHRVPPQLALFMACLDTAAATTSRSERPFHDGPLIRVVPLQAVRQEFFFRRGDEASEDAKRKAFVNSQKIGIERRLVLIKEVGGEKVIWRARPTA